MQHPSAGSADSPAGVVLQGVDNTPGAVGPTVNQVTPQPSCHQAREAAKTTYGSAGKERRRNYDGMRNGTRRSGRNRNSGSTTKEK